MSHANAQTEKRTYHSKRRTHVQPAIQAIAEESWKREFHADCRDSGAPFHPRRQSRGRLLLAAHKCLPFPSTRRRIELIRWGLVRARRSRRPRCAGKPSKTRVTVKAGTSARRSFIQVQFGVSTTQQVASRNFSQSPRGGEVGWFLIIRRGDLIRSPRGRRRPAERLRNSTCRHLF